MRHRRRDRETERRTEIDRQTRDTTEGVRTRKRDKKTEER